VSLKTKDILKAAALAKIETLQLQECFDPYHPESRANSAQIEFFKDAGTIKYRYLVAGNGCLSEGTLISTPAGPTPIEELKVGDEVYSEHGTPIKILKTYNNGRKEVVEITNRGRVWAESTDVHVWQMMNPYQKIAEKRVSEFNRDDMIVRKEMSTPLGNKSVKYAYALGALLGDGCSRQPGSKIFISGMYEKLVSKVSNQLEGTYTKCPSTNYNWKIKAEKPELYKEWCDGRYAHEKIVDLEEVKKWDRQTLLQFVAGVLDTDGSVYLKRKAICIQIGMQAKSVIDALEYAFLALWQTPVSRDVDDRDKYVNGPVYSLRLSSNAFTLRIIKELDQHTVVDSKKWKVEYDAFNSKRSRADKIGYNLKQRRIAQVYDIHVDSPTNLYCLANGLVTHNSGKSQTGGRELTWFINNTHPYWSMPEDWKNRPLQILVIGKSRSILENELWFKKIKPFFAPLSWKEIRGGNVLQAVEHKKLGHRIIFLTHSDGSQKAIDNLQAYDADIVWLDEMPTKQAVLEETQRRARRPNTLWFATFTPKSVNVKIRKIVEAAKEPIAKRYRMSRLDVPGVDTDKALAELAGYTESQKRTILFGDWSIGDEHVYGFDAETMVVNRPHDYSYTWRHVESTDPGSNRGGLLVWAEHPDTKVWYCVVAEYIDGLRDPVAFYDRCQTLTQKYNIVRRVCDPAGTPHLGHAASRKCSPPYMVPFAKNQGRKEELIKNFQKFLSNGKLKIVEEACGEFIDELSNAQRNNTGKIINSHAYHLADCAHYFSDLIPKPTDDPVNLSRDEYILRQDDKRREAEAKEYNKYNKKKSKEQVHNILMNLQRGKGKRWK
jgi:hypothetical protein